MNAAVDACMPYGLVVLLVSLRECIYMGIVEEGMVSIAPWERPNKVLSEEILGNTPNIGGRKRSSPYLARLRKCSNAWKSALCGCSAKKKA